MSRINFYVSDKDLEVIKIAKQYAKENKVSLSQVIINSIKLYCAKENLIYDTSIEDVLDIQIKYLEISVLLGHLLSERKIRTIRDLMSYTEHELSMHIHFDKRVINEIKRVLAEYNLYLNR